MAALLRSAAAAASNKGMPSSFYNKDKPNPVLQSLDKEIKTFMGFIKKRKTPDYKKPDEEAQSRPADTLFEIWNKYEPRLPKSYYQEKLLEVGDFLMSSKEYSLALWQCYDRYLMNFGDIDVEQITDVDTFKTIFFSQGFDGDSAGLTFRALMGKSISMYQVVKVSDPKLQNKQSIDRCVQILAFLRLVMQVVLPKEKLCWLVYNGTVHIYSISRYLMSLGHSAKVLEFLLWASMCMETSVPLLAVKYLSWRSTLYTAVLEFLLWASMCMETSVPLLAVKYLSWRSTLYTAVCQCYFDCKASNHAESFARRGLSKINELSQLETMSSSKDSPEREAAFRQATIKMAIMVFKRTVYETRRRPKGLLRPKTRANLKDAQNLQWPRTPSEKLLHDMFEGSATQYLCILEALSDSNRRILITSPPAPEGDVEILDVYAELFMAAQEILAGGGGHHGTLPKAQSSVNIQALAGIIKGKSLMEMATKGEDGVTIDGAIKLVKFAFCFEQWEVFEVLNDAVLHYLRLLNETKYLWDEKCLQILAVMEKITQKKAKRVTGSQVEEDHVFVDHDAAPSVLAQSVKSINLNDELIILADLLMSVITGPFTCMEDLTRAISSYEMHETTLCQDLFISMNPESIEVDIIVDAALYLWSKCKTVFQKYQTGSLDNPKYLSRMENPTKWVFILDVVHQLLCWCGISSVDPALTAEVVLRLGLVLESSANLDAVDVVRCLALLRYQLQSSRPSNTALQPTDTNPANQEMKSPVKDSSMSDLGGFQDGSQHGVSRTSMLSSSLLNVNPRNQLLQAREILELGLQNVSFARQAVALTDGKSIADISWAKRILAPHQLPPELVEERGPTLYPIPESPSKCPSEYPAKCPSVFEAQGSEHGPERKELNPELFSPEPPKDVGEVTEETQINRDELLPESLRGSATAVWNTIKDLHLELILMYHRVCLKLETMGPDPSSNLPKAFKRRTCSRMQFGSDRSMIDQYVETTEELLTRANKNNLSKALLYMQKALLLSGDGGRVSKDQKRLLENAVASIQKAQNEEKRTYLDNTGITDDQVKVSKTPPPPILLSRTDTSMVFRPAPWTPATSEKVAWYRIFARNATGSNVKARLSDYHFLGTGEQVPYHHHELRISKLKTNEKYVVALAAYTADGKLIGDLVGESTKPILANHPLPVLTTWAFLSQISYQIGCYDIAHNACDVLWSHFIADKPPPEGSTYITSAKNDFKLTLMRLNQKIMCLSSPVVLRQFLASIFISVDINVREGELFCDVLCDKGPLYNRQLKRLRECEKMLVALELAGWLNESNLALQGVVQCYGLVAPLVFYKIPSIPVFQVLQRCHAVLQEIPSGLRQKRPTIIADSLHHMTACITLHMAKVLRNWGQKTLSNTLNEAGRKLLALETVDPSKDTKELDKGTTVETTMDNGDPGSLNLQTLKSRKMPRSTRKGTVSLMKEHEAEGPMNQELKALEAHMLSMSKQAQSDHELSGNEDPNILHAYIAYLPSRIAYREVVKFRKRARYLEFFVHVAQKALTEGLPDLTLDWCEDTENWVTRRNEQIIGVRAFLTKQPGGTMTITGDDPKKFAAAMVEYSKEKRGTSRTSKATTLLDQRAASKMGTAPTLRAQNKHDLIKKSKSRSQSKMGFSGNTLVEENDVDYHSDKVKGHGQGEIGCHGDKVEGPIGEIEEEAEEWDDELEEEFQSPRAAVGGSKMVQTKTPATSAPKPKRRHKYKAIHVNNNMSDAARQAQEEAEIKSIEKLGANLPDMFRNWHRKRRLRKVCGDELPWKCQLNIVQGLAQFSSFMQKLEKREKMMGNKDNIMFKTNFMDQEWFNFETAGTLIVGWEGGPLHQKHIANQETGERKKDGTKYSTISERNESSDDSDDERQTLKPPRKPKKDLTDALDLAGYERPKTTATGIEIAAALTTGAPPPPMFTEPPPVEDTPRTYRSDLSTARMHTKQQTEPDKVLLTAQDTMDALKKSFAFFKKAIVLAHRGRYWTLLQNSARALWNCCHTALLRVYTPTPDDDNSLLTIDELRALAWKPLHMATDCMLDMMSQLQVDQHGQADKAKSKGKKLGEYFESWMGDVKQECGGASLTFENPTDKIGAVDVRFARRLILRMLEILFYEEKWEKLVDVALRFNALTNDRYSEQVIPLLVQAQRNLTEGVQELGGREPPQPHYQALMSKLNSVITAKHYLTQQLELVIDKANLPTVALGAGIDPLGHGLYTSKDALKNISVPLDIPYSLSTLYDAFDKSQYTSRALQHSRKLMILYLSAQQNTPEGMISRQPSRVDFTPNTAQPQPTMPPDISREEYLATSDVLIAPIPRSQLGTVISSYEKTIEMLLAKNEKELAAQAMHEIGNLHYHASNIRSAYKWWAEALDLILDADDALHTWRDLFKHSEDISTDILPRCGLWGCVLGGVLTSNIAQFVLTSDLGLRTECCFLSGYLFKALFRASLPHPLADRDYALYDVGEGCEVTNLVPGIDILSEKYRSDGRQVMAALRWVTEELSRGKHNLFVLPLLTLNQFFSTFVCRDLQRTVDGRILKTRVLADLGLFTEAFIVLQRLLHGERLPHTGDSSFRQVESKISPFKFDTSKPITEPANLKLLENVLDKRLSSSLSTLYGPHMTCHLSVVQAHLFVCVAQTIPVLPNIEDVILPEGHQHVIRQQTISTVSKPGVNVKSMKKGRTASKTVHEDEAMNEDGEVLKDDGDDQEESTSATSKSQKSRDPGTDMTFSGFALKRFTGSKKPITLEFVKGTLLVIADQMVGTIADVIQESAELEAGGLDDLSAAELELVVLCKLEQAEIAQLKHHAPMAARIVLASLKLLQASNIFRKKREVPVQRRPSSLKGPSHRKTHPMAVKLAEPENSQYQYQNFQSRSRLDARLWLTCRAALVKSLMTEIRGMGEVKGSDNKVLQELADCRQYCAEGLGESEACGDVEMQADFLVQGASLNIVEGKSLEHTISLLQDAIQLLSAVPRLSIPGAQLLATATVLQTDLMAIEREDDCVIFTERTCEQYLQAQTIILNQMQQLGEKIEHFYPEIKLMYFSTPTSPLRNIYLPHCLRLVQIKLRIGHAMARNAAKNIRTGSELDPVTMWSDALGVLMTALEISRVSVMREAYLEAELLLNIGKIQRMLVYLGKFQARHAVDSLLQAIKISHATDHNLGLMRQAYLEIALIYLHSGGITLMKEGSSLEALSAVFSGSEEDLSSVRTGRESMGSKKKFKSKRKLQSKSSKDDINEQEKERRAAWLAIRCAASVANTQRNRLLLIGDPSVTTLKLSEKAQQELPDFVALDLVSPYVLGEKKKVYKNEIEEELAPLIEAQEVKHVDTYDEQIIKAKEAAQDLSWIHLLGYQTILQRLCSTSTVSASSVKSDAKEKNKSAGDLGPEFDLGFISHAESDTSLNHDVVRSMLLSGTWSLRTNRLHQYLRANLKAYGSEGCAIYPPSGLELAPTGLATELSLVYKTYPQNLTNPTDMEGETQLDIQAAPGWPLAPPGVGKEPTVADDKLVTSPTENEVTLQWYQPSLEETDPTRPDAIGAESRILLLYAIYSKTVGSGNMPARIAWVPMSQLNDLHDRLAVLMQRAEVYLQDGPQKKPKKEPVPPSPTPAKGKKSVQRIKALSPKVRKDEHLESLLRQCADDIANLLGAIVETDPANPEIPFEVNRKNIRMLESLFDPSFGAIVKGTDLLQWLIKLF